MASRWSALIAAGGLMWGLNFSTNSSLQGHCSRLRTKIYFDLPAALSTPLQTYLRESDEEFVSFFSIIYSAYSIPNSVLPFFAGVAEKRYGKRHIWTSCITAVIFGQLVFAFGVQARSRLFMVGGRLMLGLVGETLIILSSDLVTRHFKNDRLAMALASLTLAATLGTAANTFIIPRLAQLNGVVFAAWFVAINSVLVCDSTVATITTMDTKSSTNYHLKQVKFLDALKWMPPQFGYLSMMAFTGYGLIIPFNNTAQQFLAATFYPGDEAIAGSVVGLTHIIVGILCFPFGWLLEQPRSKKSPNTLIMTKEFFLLAHLPFLMHFLGPVIPVSLLGVGNGLFGVALWPFVASTILNNTTPVASRYESLSQRIDSFSEHDVQLQELSSTNHDRHVDFHESDMSKRNESMLVMGYGIMTSLLNLSFAVLPVILAVAKPIAGYPGMEAGFVALSVAGIVASVRLVRIWRWPRNRQEGVLEHTDCVLH